MTQPVEYLSATQILASFAGYREAGVSKAGWYFWDETWANAYGPYTTEEEANRKLAGYTKQLNRV